MLFLFQSLFGVNDYLKFLQETSTGKPLSTGKQKKVSHLSTCRIVESKEYLHKRRDHPLECADRETIHSIP